MKNNFIFLSNSTGGIKTFEEILIKYLSKKKLYCNLIGKNIKNKSNKNLNFNSYNSDCIKNIFKTVKILNKIKNKEKNNKFIFIFSNQFIFVIYFFYIKFFFKSKKIYLFIHSHITKKKISLIIIAFISTIFSLWINKLFYVSNFTKKWWEKRFYFTLLSKSKINYNSVNLQKFKKKNKKKFCIGFVGRADKEKGLEIFLNIANKFKNKYQFNIFNNDKNLNFERSNNIKIFFNLKRKYIYKNIDLLLITSPIENCPYTVLEAKSYGIPTLAFLTEGGINEIIKNNYDGFLIKNNNLNKLNKVFLKIKKKYKIYSKNALKSSNKYNADYKIPKLINKLI